APNQGALTFPPLRPGRTESTDWLRQCRLSCHAWHNWGQLMAPAGPWPTPARGVPGPLIIARRTGKIESVRQEACGATAFPTELSGDLGVHRTFVDLVAGHDRTAQ